LLFLFVANPFKKFVSNSPPENWYFDFIKKYLLLTLVT